MQNIPDCTQSGCNTSFYPSCCRCRRTCTQTLPRRYTAHLHGRGISNAKYCLAVGVLVRPVHSYVDFRRYPAVMTVSTCITAGYNIAADSLYLDMCLFLVYNTASVNLWLFLYSAVIVHIWHVTAGYKERSA